jgi:hypothetical protein
MSRHRFQLTPEAASALQAAELAEKDGPTRGRASVSIATDACYILVI